MNDFHVNGPMPKALRKAKKENARRSGEEKDKGPELLMDTFTIQEADGRLCIYRGNNRVWAASYGPSLKAGEVWNCAFVQDGCRGEEFIAVTKVSDAVETAEEPKEEVPEPMPEPKPAAKKVRSVSVKTDANTRKELEKLRKENFSLKKKNALLTEQNKVKKASVTQLEARDRKIRELTEKLDSEKQNVKALKAKNSQARIDSLNSKVVTLQDQLESRELEIVMLREKLRQHGDDDIKVVPRMPNKVFTCLTGPTGIHCSLLTGDRYSAYFNPMKGSIRFVPDAKGDIECVNCMVHIHGLSRFSNFQGLRNLDMKIDGECVEVTL